MKSVDGGSTWEPISSPLFNPPTAVRQDPNFKHSVKQRYWNGITTSSDGMIIVVAQFDFSMFGNNVDLGGVTEESTVLLYVSFDGGDNWNIISKFEDAFYP